MGTDAFQLRERDRFLVPVVTQTALYAQAWRPDGGRCASYWSHPSWQRTILGLRQWIGMRQAKLHKRSAKHAPKSVRCAARDTRRSISQASCCASDNVACTPRHITNGATRDASDIAHAACEASHCVSGHVAHVTNCAADGSHGCRLHDWRRRGLRDRLRGIR